MTDPQPIARVLSRLRAGEISSTRLVKDCLSAIQDPGGEGSRAFTKVFAESARAEARSFDTRRLPGALAGLPVSIKDLFDVAGQPTPAGSIVLAGAAPAERDAKVVQRLRAAGAILVGRTNMSEFAYSGLGLNPHYGTPSSPWDRRTRRIPGGSSSGAAVSVADGMAYAAIGTDTGGSVRIPAALCGLVGFKPTARRVPLDGVLPLSFTLDSVGPIAPTVACCALIDAVLAAEEPVVPAPINLTGTRLAVLQGYVAESCDRAVSSAYSAALETLSAAGACLVDTHFSALDDIAAANRHGGFSAPEAYAWHRALLERCGDLYDRRVSMRIVKGREVTAADYIDLIHVRHRIIAEAERAFRGFDAVLMPSVPKIAPPIADLEASDAAYLEANANMLRNTSVINFLDGCALSIPCHRAGDAPAGLMVAGLAMRDRDILSLGAAIEKALAITREAKAPA